CIHLQFANVDQRVGKIGENADWIALEDEVKAHDHAATDAPIPKRNRDYAFALPLRGDPLHKETHRKRGVPDQAEDNEIAPVQPKKPVLFADPCDCDKCECVHKRAIINPSFRAKSRNLVASLQGPSTGSFDFTQDDANESVDVVRFGNSVST